MSDLWQPWDEAILACTEWTAAMRNTVRHPARRAKYDALLKALVPLTMLRRGETDLALALQRAEGAQRILREDRSLLNRQLRGLLKWCLQEIAREARQEIRWREARARHAETQ